MTCQQCKRERGITNPRYVCGFVQCGTRCPRIGRIPQESRKIRNEATNATP